jgi:hypothetical protein
MADPVVCAGSKHRGHVALLKMPYTAGCKDLFDFAGESDWILQIIEHSNRGNDLGRFGAGSIECRGRKELRHKVMSSG